MSEKAMMSNKGERRGIYGRIKPNIANKFCLKEMVALEKKDQF